MKDDADRWDVKRSAIGKIRFTVRTGDGAPYQIYATDAEALALARDLHIHAAALSVRARETELPKLKSRELLKGTGDVLKDLAHAEQMTDTSEPGFGEVVCSGRELDFVNRALRVAMGEIKELRKRLKSKPALTSSSAGWATPEEKKK